MTVGDGCATFGCQIPETALKATQVDHCLREVDVMWRTFARASIYPPNQEKLSR